MNSVHEPEAISLGVWVPAGMDGKVPAKDAKRVAANIEVYDGETERK